PAAPRSSTLSLHDALPIFLLIFVIPQFEAVFQNFGADLPAFTQMLVSMSRFMVSYWWMVLGIFLASVFGIIALYKRSERFAHFIDRKSTRLNSSHVKISYA